MGPAAAPAGLDLHPQPLALPLRLPVLLGEQTAIEACEAAWELYGGVFGVVVPDNTKAIVHTADPLKPRIIDSFLAYAQSRGFHVDPTRKKHPKGSHRGAVRDVRDDCFAGEKLLDLDVARARGRRWSIDEYGMLAR